MGVKLLLWSVAPGPPAPVAYSGMTATGMVTVRLLPVLPILSIYLSIYLCVCVAGLLASGGCLWPGWMEGWGWGGREGTGVLARGRAGSWFR